MKQCEVCGKGSKIAGKRVLLRGHYNPTVTKRRYPNIQNAVLSDGTKVRACTQCIKKLPKNLASAKKKKKLVNKKNLSI